MADNQLPEAPISVNTKLKSPNGFEYQLTMRKGVTEEDFSALLTLIAKKEETLLAKQWTPLPIQGGFAKKDKAPAEYVEGRTCPKDDARIVLGTGKIKEKCEHYKFDYTTKKNVGSCDYIVWN